MLSDRPLTTSSADRAMLVGRDDLISTTRRQMDLGGHLLIHGRPRSGKTSLVNQVVDGRRVHRVGPVDDLDSLARDLGAAGLATGSVEQAFTDLLTDAAYDTVVLDMPMPGPLARTFASLRDVWWSHRVAWVVVVDTAGHAVWTRRPADTFFHMVEVGPLETPDAEELLHRRAKRLDPPDEETLLKIAPDIVGATDRLPGALVRAARAALAAPDPKDWARRAASTDDVAGQLGRAHQKVFRFLRIQGPTSASDPEILDAVGLTRTRIAQVLSDLSDQGLTDSERHGRQVLYSATEGTHEA